MKPEDADVSSSRGNKFNLTPTEGTNFSLSHRHSGLHGDGQVIKLANLDTTAAYPTGSEPLYVPINATTSGRTWRLQVEEVTDPDTGQVYGRLIVSRVA